jgi:hypothetical protein
MKKGLVLGVLTVIALLALAVTGAQAGGGGGTPSALTGFFVCNSISGDDAGLRVDIKESTWAFNPTNVRIGNATLACAFAKLFRAGSDTPINPDLSPGTPNGLKCYSVSVGRQTSNPPTYSFTDALLGTDMDVHGSSIQYICAPAILTQNP